MSKPKDTLRMSWRKGDLWYDYPTQKADARLLNHFMAMPRPSCTRPMEFERALVEELEARGYDLTTLKFSIKLKKQDAPPANTEPPTARPEQTGSTLPHPEGQKHATGLLGR